MSPQIIILISLGTISAGFLVTGFYYRRRVNRLKAIGKKAPAVVIKNHWEPSGKGGYYRPEIRFMTDKEEQITRVLKMGTRPPIKEGKAVEVLYDPDKPTNVEINSFFRMTFMPALIICLGIGSVLLMIYLLAISGSWQ